MGSRRPPKEQFAKKRASKQELEQGDSVWRAVQASNSAASHSKKKKRKDRNRSLSPPGRLTFASDALEGGDKSPSATSANDGDGDGEGPVFIRRFARWVVRQNVQYNELPMVSIAEISFICDMVLMVALVLWRVGSRVWNFVYMHETEAFWWGMDSEFAYVVKLLVDVLVVVTMVKQLNPLPWFFVECSMSLLGGIFFAVYGNLHQVNDNICMENPDAEECESLRPLVGSIIRIGLFVFAQMILTKTSLDGYLNRAKADKGFWQGMKGVGMEGASNSTGKKKKK